MLKILLVDDHQLLLDSLQFLFKELDPHLQLLTTESANQAYTIIKNNTDLDLMVLDLKLDDFDGLDLLLKLKRKHIIVPNVILSASENLSLIRQALDLGSMGFIPKSYSGKKLINAIRLVLAGHLYLPKELENALSSSESVPKAFNLSQRQLEVIKQMVLGKTNKQIAQNLCIAETTIKSHITVILRSLEVSNRHECIQKVLKIGLI